MPVIDLVFPVLGKSLPLDHGYALYSAISRMLGPQSHERNGLGVFGVNGLAETEGGLLLSEASSLRCRTPVEGIPALLQLSGKELDVAGHPIRLGVPRTWALTHAASLFARIVTIKGFCEPEPFLEAATRQLDAMGVRGKPAIPLRDRGEHAGEPMRRVLQIKDKTVVGFSLLVSELTAEESLTLQEQGVGGRRRMGCGLFVPAHEGEQR
ncbi:MAG: type I-MYXAN CRISPR-associated protein Cas6/Cmx6 [Sedimentisphaerales bacterium]|nr:type I-MYXAN CRISPR-associated protein Cas6/Cmx6 [Sedimentisphaerales bacterium]